MPHKEMSAVAFTRLNEVAPATGVPLRDWFAGQALCGLIPSPARPGVILMTTTEMASQAYAYADAMMKARAT